MATVKYSGSVASFHCPTEATIRSLKVHFIPKQLGSGTPSPENVREIVGWDDITTYKTKKNIGHIVAYSAGTLNSPTNVPYIQGNYGNSISQSEPLRSVIFTQTEWHDDISIYHYRNGYWCIQVDNLQFGQRYDLSFKITNITNNPLNASLSNIRIGIPYGNQFFATILNDNTILFKNFLFTQSKNRPLQSDIAIYMCGLTCTLSDFMITPASMNDGVFEPYYGSTTNYEFGVLGKNKFDPNCDMWNHSVYSKNGDEITQSGSDGRGWTDANLNSIHLKAGTYTLTCSDENNFNLRTSVDNYETNISLLNGDGTFTLPQDCDVKIKHSVKSGNSYPTTFTVQLELGSSATTYEPYNPNKTVYGGWVDLITGEVCEEWYNVDPSQWKKYKESNGYYAYRLDGIPSAEKYSTTAGVQKLSNIISQYGSFNSSNMDKNIIQYPNYLALQQDISVEMVEYIYKLAEPITYSLAPIEMQTFLSHNNIWSNADYVEVEYDLHETQNILARKQFIMANQPHIVKPAAAPLQNFVTDMVAPLKECKVHFSPVQEGEGDPSPENVRPISGWTGVEVNCAGKNIIPDDLDFVDGKFKPTDGVISGSVYVCCYFRVPKGQLYWSCDVTGQTYICLMDEPIRSGATTYNTVTTSNRRNYTLDNSDGHPYMAMFGFGDGNTPLQTVFKQRGTRVCLLNYSDTISPSKRTVLSIDWTNEAGTIYGGYVDLIKGELIETYKKINLGDLSVVTYGNASYDGDNGTNAMYYIIKTGTGIGYPNGVEPIGDKIVCAGKNKGGYYIGTWTNPDDHIWEFCINSNNQLHVVFGNTTVGITSDMTFAQRREKITEWLQSNPISIVVPLETPITYSITSAALKSLRGTNNIWSNANGNIELSYWKH